MPAARPIASLFQGQLFPQPSIAIALGVLALLTLTATWTAAVVRPSWSVTVETVVAAAFLAVAVAVAYRYPVHVRRHTKVAMTSMPLYAMALLLPPPLAGLSAAAGTMIGESIEKPRRGTRLCDSVTATGRWVILVVLASLVAHGPVAAGGRNPLLLFVTALLMLGGDLVTSALEIGPMGSESPLWLIRATARETALAEVVQYSLGILGVYAAAEHPWMLLVLLIPVRIVYLAFKRSRELQEGTRQLLERMADVVDLRDPYTGGHSRRVAATCRAIVAQLELSGPEAELIVAAARVHDVGKIAVPDRILLKRDPLTPEEWAIMASHAERGAELLARFPDFARGVEFVRHHHECWDGTGYPGGLSGLDIPFGARVIAVTDSFDAMTSDRPYRKALSLAEAEGALHDGRGRQWDPAIVDAMLRCLKESPARFGADRPRADRAAPEGPPAASGRAGAPPASRGPSGAPGKR